MSLSDSPWRSRLIGNNPYSLVGWSHCVVSYNEPIAFVRRESDAHAIAALPDLIEALEQNASDPCCETPGCNVVDPRCSTMVARSALHKAGLQ